MRMQIGWALLLGSLSLAGCGSHEPAKIPTATPVAEGDTFMVATANRATVLEAAGTAAAWADATLSTKLMGTVTEVAVREGDRVRRDQVLVRIDARDLEAKAAQVAASVAEAEAYRDQALTHAGRLRALFAEEAAPRAQLDAAETALASAEARVKAAYAAASELEAVRAYSVVRAPFAGVVTARRVDPGAFAAPGTPLVTVQDVSRLRLTVTVAPAAVHHVKRGDAIAATLEGLAATARVEGVVPATDGNLYTVNATLDNRDGRFLAGSAATLALPQGERPSIVIPAAAVVRRGDLAGVQVLAGGRTQLRWVRLGFLAADSVEVLSGLLDGERLIVPIAAAQAR